MNHSYIMRFSSFFFPVLFMFCFSCAEPQSFSSEETLQVSVAYIQDEPTHHTKHIRKQQHDICERLKKIKKTLEKTKKKTKQE